MHLLLAPQVLVKDEDGSYLRPDLGALPDRGHLWGQASCKWDGKGKQAIWFRGTSEELDGVLKVSGAEYLGLCSAPSEDDAMVAALKAGDLKSARDEFMACYREPTTTAEAALVTAEAGRVLRDLILAIGLAAAAALLGVSTPVLLGLTTLHQDNFNRANQALTGNQMSDGLGAWGISGGNWAIVSNKVDANGSINTSCFDSVGPAAGDQRVTFKVITDPSAGVSNWGPVARYADNNNFYYARLTANPGRLALFKKVTGTLTQLGSNGSTATAANDIVACDCAGTAITAFLNGATEVGPITDSDLATGVGGITQTGNGSRQADDWKVEVVAGGSPLVDGGLVRSKVIGGKLVR